MTVGRRLSIAVVAACPMPERRGTPARIQRLSEVLARRGHDVHLVTYHLGEGEVSEDLTLHRTIRVPTYRKRTPGPSLQKLLVLDPLLAVKLSGLIRNRHFDIVHAHHYEGLLAAVVGGIGAHAPIVYDAHTMLGSELPSYRLGLPRRWKAGLGDFLDRRLPHHADHVTAVTEKIRDKMLDHGLAPDRVTVVSDGVEHEFFEACDAVSRPGPGAAPRLVFTGNLARYQGVEHLLAAYRDVRAVRPDVRLLLVTGSDFTPYEQLARDLGVRDSIELRSATLEELPQLLVESDIALNPRVVCDGIPLKLLNYMAAARPIVSFAGSAPILRHGENGLVIDGEDTAGFAGAILQLLDDPELSSRLGARARSDAEARHRWIAIAEQVEITFHEVLRRSEVNLAAAGRPTGA